MAMALAFGEAARAGFVAATSDDVTSYGVGVDGGTIHVVRESAGTFRHKQSVLGSGT